MNFLRLQRLHLVNFKNYDEALIEFNGRIHCFFGRNGSGKTNLLEAIHYLSFTKGFALSSDANNVKHSHDHFQVAGVFEKDNQTSEIVCSLSGSKKVMSLDGKDYGRFSDHIGKYPLVMVAPNDIELIWDGAEARRRFFDALMSQLDKEFLDRLITYNAQLKQRNSLLRMAQEGASIDQELLDMYDGQIVSAGEVIFTKRRTFVSRFAPVLEEHYAFLAEGATETAGVAHLSELNQFDFAAALREKRDADLSAGRTTVGPHRDDFAFTLSGNAMKSYGSQGQQKSFLIALKLAEFESI